MKRLLFIISVIITHHINAQTDTSTKLVTLDEVVISVNKTEEKKSEVPYRVEVIKSKDIELINSQTSADMLQNTGNVFVQKSQGGGGSPILRGLEASRVLLVVDGVRMNNAIYRAGHLQDVITIDNSMLDRTEVLYGPSSVVYGSDALGGVMHFYTKNPLLGSEGKTKFNVNAYSRYTAANKGLTGHVDFNVGMDKLAFLTSISYSKFGDLRSGGNTRNPDATFGKTFYYAERINGIDSMIKNSDPNIQKFTGYTQMDVMEKILFQQNEKMSHTLNFQYSGSSDVPRYDRLQEYSGGKLKYAEWYYGPQNRMLASYQNKIKSDGKLFNHLTTTLAYQAIDQERVSRKFNNKNKKDQLEQVAVYSLNADFTKLIDEKQMLHYGLEGTYNDVKSTAKLTDIVTGVEKDADTRYPDGGSTMNSVAAYVTHSWKLSEMTLLSEGLRFSSIGLSSKFNDTTFFPLPYKTAEQKNGALNGNIGLVFKLSKDVRFHVLGSTGFRSPNVDDLTKIFESGGGILIIPNADLKPEYAYNIEFGASNTLGEKVKLEAVYFYTYLKNAMVLKNDQLNGADSVLYGGTMSKVQSMQNANNANIQGVSGNLYVDFNDNISLKSSINYTMGSYNDRENDTIVPLDHIAPLYGQTSLIYKFKKMESMFYLQYSGAKLLKDYSPSGEDNLSQATVNGMPKWMTFNFKSSFMLSKFVYLNVGVENIFDVHYRVFASGVSAPGRNVVLSLRAKI